MKPTRLKFGRNEIRLGRNKISTRDYKLVVTRLDNGSLRFRVFAGCRRFSLRYARWWWSQPPEAWDTLTYTQIDYERDRRVHKNIDALRLVSKAERLAKRLRARKWRKRSK